MMGPLMQNFPTLTCTTLHHFKILLSLQRLVTFDFKGELCRNVIMSQLPALQKPAIMKLLIEAAYKSKLTAAISQYTESL